MPLWTRRRPHPVLFAVMGVVVGVLFGVVTYQTWRQDQGLRDHGREAPARVVEVSGSGKGRKVFVEFEVGGQTVRSKVGGRMETRGQVGQSLPVRYDERRPQRDVYDARITTQGRIVYLLGAMSLIGLVGFPLIAVFALRGRAGG